MPLNSFLFARLKYGKFKNQYMDLRKRLLELHEQENGMNKEMGRISKQIRELEKKKQKIARHISGNMRLRNKLINQL